MNIAELFNQRKEDLRYNTSYPLHPSDWAKWKVDGRLPFAYDKSLSLYFHIPFCPSLCNFCEYVRFKVPDTHVQTRYVDTMLSDASFFLQSNAGIEALEGLDIGGGTPTALADEPFCKLLQGVNAIMRNMKLCDDFRPSIEATFSTITEAKAKSIADAGFTRVSFGIQNVSREFLRENNRRNGSLWQMQEAMEWCRTCGIRIINIDLMYGFSGMSDEQIKNTLRVCGSLHPEHLTVYELRTNMIAGIHSAPREELFRQYALIFDIIRDMGYHGRFGQNTFSTAADDCALSSYLKRRMLLNGSYKGFGISAQSKSKVGLSYNFGKNHVPMNECIGKKTFEDDADTYILPPEEMLSKYLAICGYHACFNLSIMQEIIGEDPLSRFSDVFDFLFENELIQREKSMIHFTRKGFCHYAAILSLFYGNSSDKG